MRCISLLSCLAGTLVLAIGASAQAADDDGCSHFAWDVTHEVKVMSQAPVAVTAQTQNASRAPSLSLDKPYEVKLADQSTVKYSVPPAKPTLSDSAQGGIVHFRTASAGLYRISLTTGHWIDVISDGQLIKSKDFSGSHSCPKPHKIVEFELPADHDLVLQFSGATEATVLTSITPVAAPGTAN